jgi:hypothetical protein
MIRPFAMGWAAMMLVMGGPLRGQDAPVAGTNAPPKIEDRIKELRETRKKASARIQQIDAVLIPVKEEIAAKLFEITKEEYRALLLQSKRPDVAARYFQKMQAAYTATQDGIAQYFDDVYESLLAGHLWMGREDSLVKQDAEMFNEMEKQVLEGMKKLSNWPELQKLIEEREKLELASSIPDPFIKYHLERRAWWRNYPDYIPTLQDTQSTGTP